MSQNWLLQDDPALARAHELVEKHRPSQQTTLWLNPPACLGRCPQPEARFWQPHYSAHEQLLRHGWQHVEPNCDRRWQQIVLYASKHKEENWGLLEAARTRLTPDGRLLFAVPNDYGSKSYQERLQQQEILCGYESGRKSRLYIIKRGEESVPTPLAQPQQNAAGLWSCPGLFSWNNVDRGSFLLAGALRDAPLAGPVADLGAGWGYLGLSLAPNLPLHLFESDRRGLEAARLNLEGRPLTTHWCDLSNTEQWPAEAPTSFATVISNPPFHQGKKEETALGQLFARLAHRLLSKGGAYWMVGNTHLAYPRLLSTLFSKVDILQQKDGFTVLRAYK